MESERSDDVINVGRERLDWAAYWSGSSAAVRALLGLATVTAVVAAVLGVAAARTHPTRRTVNVVRAAPGAVSVDASGCPTGTQCRVDARAQPAIATALTSAFPGARTVSTVSTTDRASGRVYRRVVVAQVAGDTVVVGAQCIPGAQAAGARSIDGDESFVDLAGNTKVLASTVVIVAPGATGCSASVVVDTAAASPKIEAAARRLAVDPSVRLAP